jgi:hypothetical protein
LGTFIKICRENTNVVEMGTKYRALYMMLIEGTLKFLSRWKYIDIYYTYISYTYIAWYIGQIIFI